MTTHQVKRINVWIAPLADKRKHCRNCEMAITEDNQHISVGEYIAGKYTRAFHACGVCLVDTIKARLHAPALFDIQVRAGYKRPWYHSMLSEG